MNAVQLVIKNCILIALQPSLYRKVETMTMQRNISLNSVQSPCLCLSTYPFPISTLSKIIISILGASRTLFFFFFKSNYNLLSHVDLHTGFMSFVTFLTCNPLQFISQPLHTFVIPVSFFVLPWVLQRYCGRFAAV